MSNAKSVDELAHSFAASFVDFAAIMSIYCADFLQIANC